MRKHIVSILVCLSMLLIILPMTAFASTPEVTIGGETVDTTSDWYATTNTDGEVITEGADSENYNIFVRMTEVSGIDVAAVTLKNATINNNGHEAIETTGCDLYIILESNSQILVDSSSSSCKNAISSDNVTIDGGGILTINVNGDNYAYGGDVSKGLNLFDYTPEVDTYYDAGDGFALWEHDSNTLTLHDASINNEREADGGIYGPAHRGIALPSGDITIVVEGTNDIRSKYVEGIGYFNTNVTLDGDGILNADGKYWGFSLGKSDDGGSLTFEEGSDVTLNGTVYIYNGTTHNLSIYGDVTIDSDINWSVYTIDAVTIADGAALTIQEGVTLYLNSAGSVTKNGSGKIVNNGTIILPYNYTKSDIDALDITGDGTIKLSNGTYYKVYIDGKIYAYGGYATGGRNFNESMPTQTTYYDAGSGYVLWEYLGQDLEHKEYGTLTLHNASISNVREPDNDSVGSAHCGIALPWGDITIVVEGTNNISSKYNYGIGYFDTNVTLDGNGTLNVDGKNWDISLGNSDDGGSLTFKSGSSVKLNGTVYIYDGTTQNFFAYGDVTIDSITHWSGHATIADDAVLTITEDSKLYLNDASSIKNNGQIVNNGTILLPYDYTKSDIEALNITGDGMIQLYDAANDKYRIYIDGKIYGYVSGPISNFFSPVPTEDAYYKAGDGYAIFTPADSTLTLHNVYTYYNQSIVLPNIPITMVLEGENKFDYLTVNNTVTVGGSGTLDVHIIDCTSEGAALNVNSGATLNALVTTKSNGVYTNSIYGSFITQDFIFKGGEKLALMPNSVFILDERSSIEFYEGSTLNDMTFGEGSEIVNNGYMILPMGTTSEQIAELPLRGAGDVFAATGYNELGEPDFDYEKPYTNDGVQLTNLIGGIMLDYNEVKADDKAGFTWLKTGSGDDEVWTLTLSDNTYIRGLGLPEGAIVINTTADSIIGEIMLEPTNPINLTFTGSGRLGIRGNIWSGQGGEVTIDEGADVTISNGFNVGIFYGVNGVLTVNGTLSVGSLINTGRLEIGSKGVLNVTGDGVRLNGMDDGDIVYDDTFVIKDGGTFNANCKSVNIEVFTNTTEATEDVADDVIVIPNGYMPDGYLIKIVSEKDGEDTYYAYAIAKTNQQPTLNSAYVNGAGGKLTLKKSSNNNNDDDDDNDNDSHHSYHLDGSGSHSYKLSFDTNGGPAIQFVSKAYGTVIDLSTYNPVREGYEFMGWYTDEKLTNSVTSIKLDENTKLYAKWVQKTSDNANTPKNTNPFIDVNNGDYFHDAVLWAVEKGITSGTASNLFSPNMSCTRAQTLTLLWKANGSPEPTSTNCPFTDVDSNSYYYKAVLWAVENGIASGTSATSFDPEKTVTRAQSITFMWRSEGKPDANCANPFTDVTGDDYSYNAIMWAVGNNITQGSSTSTFSSGDFCTRGQIVTFLYRSQL